MSETELKPCFICGGTDLERFLLSMDKWEGPAVGCNRCCAQCPETLWNTRADQPRPVSRDDVIQCLLATTGQSEGIAADAILRLLKSRPAAQDVRGKLFDHMQENHGLTLLDSELDAIESVVLSGQPRPAETDKEKLASWMCDQGYATGHGDSMDDLLAELKGQIQPRPVVPDDIEKLIEQDWIEQGGIDASTGRAWLTPRMQREAKALELRLAQQPEGDKHGD